MASASNMNLTTLLENLNFVVPLYLQKLLNYTGFDNALSISMISEEDIAKMETFAREELPELLDSEEKKTFYGIFEKKITSFIILTGHKKLLQVLIEKCKQYTRQCISTNTTASTIRTNESSNGTSKYSKRNKESTEHASSLNSEEQKAKAIVHIKDVLKNYIFKFLKDIVQQEEYQQRVSKLDSINVKIKSEFALIHCPECDFVSKNSMQVEKGRTKWVLSNFNKHYKTHFKKRHLENSHVDKNSKKIKNTSILQYMNVPTRQENLNSSNETADEDFTANADELNSNNTVIHNTNSVSTPGSSSSMDFSNDGLIFEEHKSVTKASPLSPPVQSTKRKSKTDRVIAKRLLSFDTNQSKITDFYDLCEVIKQKITETPCLLQGFQGTFRILADTQSHIEQTATGFFDMLKEASVKNSLVKSKSGNRYNDSLKRMSLYLFLTAGRLAYQTLYANMNRALPSITTLLRELETFSSTREGEVNITGLDKFMKKRNYPNKKIFISEDQTGIVKRVRYSAETNQMIGFVFATSTETGFPIQNEHEVNCIADIKNAFESKILSSNAYVYMAQPLQEKAPAFCLSIFGSDNRFTAADVLNRWDFLERQAKLKGISVEGFSSDGDSRCLKAMKIKSGLSSQCIESPYAPYFHAIYSTELPVMVQDTIHISTKIKTRFLKETKLPMGNYTISKQHIRTIIEEYPKTQHFLCLSHLELTDKMNFDSINKMSAPCVINILKQEEGAEATAQLLVLTRYILDSFIDKSITVDTRVYYIWYTTFFLRLWRAWIRNHKEFTLSKNWLTLNTYTCVEINAHALLLMIDKCRLDQDSFLPWLFSSQPCERFFRQTRSMTSTYSTIVNYDMLDLLNRNTRIQTINDIVADTGMSFQFPREANDKMGRAGSAVVQLIPTMEEIMSTIEKAARDALTDAKKLGILFSETESRVILASLDIPDTGFLSEDTEIEENGTSVDNAEINIEDRDDIEKELVMFSNMTELDIRDYSQKTVKNSSPFLNIILNNKTVLVRKSTLCWLFSNNISGRLSTDRIYRVRGMSALKPSSSITVQNYNQSQDLDQSQPTGDNTPEEETNSKILLQSEKYYAVYYDDTYYIGRIIEISENSTCKVKFLKADLDKFIWPRSEDVQLISNKFVFYGPIVLSGNGPFLLKTSDKYYIEKMYKIFKKKL